MKRRVFDETFRQMAVDLSYAKGSVREAAEERGIDSGRISKWQQRDNKLSWPHLNILRVSIMVGGTSQRLITKLHFNANLIFSPVQWLLEKIPQYTIAIPAVG